MHLKVILHYSTSCNNEKSIIVKTTKTIIFRSSWMDDAWTRHTIESALIIGGLCSRPSQGHIFTHRTLPICPLLTRSMTSSRSSISDAVAACLVTGRRSAIPLLPVCSRLFFAVVFKPQKIHYVVEKKVKTSRFSHMSLSGDSNATDFSIHKWNATDSESMSNWRIKQKNWKDKTTTN